MLRLAIAKCLGLCENLSFRSCSQPKVGSFNFKSVLGYSGFVQAREKTSCAQVQSR